MVNVTLNKKNNTECATYAVNENAWTIEQLFPSCTMHNSDNENLPGT